MGGYVAVIVVAILLIPIVLALAAKRPAGGRQAPQRDNGVTPAQPSADQPTPRSGKVNKIASDATKRVPPG